MYLLQILIVDVSIDLSRSNRRMTQQCLYRSDICPFLYEGCCKAVSECMRCHLLIDPDELSISFYDILHCISRQPLSTFEITEIDKNIRTLIGPRREILLEFFSCTFGEKNSSEF